MGGLSLKARLGLLTSLLLGLLALLCLALLMQQHSVSQALESVYRNRLVPVQLLRQMDQALRADLPAELARYSDGELSLAELRRRLDLLQPLFEQRWAAYRETEMVDEELHLIARAEPQLRLARAALQRLRERLDSSEPAALRGFVRRELEPVLQALGQTLGELVDVQLGVARREADAGQQAFERARWGLPLLILLCGGLGGGLALSVWSGLRRDRQVGDAREQRLKQFYQALSRCNQLIVREPAGAAQLYEALCRICVESGHAMLAAVIETDGKRAWRSAAEGPVDELLREVPIEWSLDSTFGQISLIGQVLRSGSHLISNEAGLDLRVAHLHDSAVARGAQAAAVFPLRRGGAIVGTLMLFAAEPGFFEPALVALLDEMAGDVSFALDNLDREQARRQALQDAQAGRDLFQRLFNVSSVSAALTSLADQRVLEVNEVLCRRYGLTREQMLGRRFGELGVGLVPEDRRRYYALLDSQGHVRNLEVAVRTIDGRRLHSLVSGELLDYEGQRCVLSTSVDITELRGAQQAAQQRAEAESANRAKTEFLAQMSHELRTPLNAILGFAQLLEASQGSRLSPKQLEWLGHIRNAGWHLASLINDVLDIAGIEAGRVQLQCAALMLQSALRQALALSESLAAQHQVQLLPLQAPVVPLWVHTDARRLQQVLLNLLSNAVKYNRRGGRVTVSLDLADRQAVVRICDTGLGMDAQQLAQLFEPFNRLGREQGPVEGSGIGMALSRQLLQLMGAEIHVRREAGVGTEVELRLACVEAPAA